MNHHLKEAFFCMIVFISISCKPGKTDHPQTVNNHHPEAVIEIRTFHTHEGWGYDIYVNQKKYIHQPHIPAIKSNIGFKTEEEAKKVAGFAADKISKNIFPPSVSAGELDSLEIAY